MVRPRLVILTEWVRRLARKDRKNPQLQKNRTVRRPASLRDSGQAESGRYDGWGAGRGKSKNPYPQNPRVRHPTEEELVEELRLLFGRGERSLLRRIRKGIVSNLLAR